MTLKKAQLTGLWATNCATIQQVLILKFAFGPETELPGSQRGLGLQGSGLENPGLQGSKTKIWGL